MSSSSEIVLAFDLYGTILSTASIAEALAEHLGKEKAAEVAATWRTLQLEYTWRLNSMGESSASYMLCGRENGSFDNGAMHENQEDDTRFEQHLPKHSLSTLRTLTTRNLKPHTNNPTQNNTSPSQP